MINEAEEDEEVQSDLPMKTKTMTVAIRVKTLKPNKRVHSSSDSDGLKTDEDLSLDIEPKG